jgi:hypothetical protein
VIDVKSEKSKSACWPREWNDSFCPGKDSSDRIKEKRTKERTTWARQR